MTAPALLLLTLSASAYAPGSAAIQAPPPATPGPVASLRETIARARDAAPRVLAERARADSAARAERMAGRLADPTLEFSSENWRGGPGFEASRDLDVFALFQQPLELSGVRGARRRVAKGESAESAAVSLSAERQVQVEATRAYARAVIGDDLVKALEAQTSRLREVVRMLERRVEEGWSAEADLMKFRGELARAEIQTLRSRLDRDAARRRLAALVGATPPEGPFERPALPLQPLPEGEAMALAGAALEGQPEVQMAAARLARAEGSWELEQARGRPDVALSGGYKRTEGLDTAVAGVVLAVPLFSRNGRAKALAEGEAAAAATTLAAVREAQRDALAGLIESARALSARALTLEQDLVQPTEVARAAALSAFREGASDALRLVDAERAHAEARREALELTVEALAAVVEARLALGLEALP